jgi:hypothetical protein
MSQCTPHTTIKKEVVAFLLTIPPFFLFPHISPYSHTHTSCPSLPDWKGGIKNKWPDLPTVAGARTRHQESLNLGDIL